MDQQGGGREMNGPFEAPTFESPTMMPEAGPRAGRRISAGIADRIREMIVTQQVEPGQRLPSERELADLLRVSRPSVRDALRVLEADGLLRIRVGSGGGAFVAVPGSGVVSRGLENLVRMSSVTPEDVAEARLILETGLVGLIVARADDEDLEALESLCEEAEQALQEGTYGPAHSERFHTRLAECAHNPALSLLAGTFAGPLSMVGLRKRTVRENRHRRSIAYHRRIVQAIRDRDAQEFERIAREHLTEGLPD